MMVIELPSPPKLLHPSVIRNASNTVPAVVVDLLGDVVLDPVIREAHIEKTSIRLSHLVDELLRREEAQSTQTIPNVNRAEGGNGVSVIAPLGPVNMTKPYIKFCS
jgi:hypothetical protein